VEVAILDLAMPAVDGYEVARQIRQCVMGNEVLLIALTGYADDAHRQQALQAGFHHYLQKPVDFADLRDIVDTRRRQGAPPCKLEHP
jgi:CheY-like chemotaxis protein